MQSDKKRELASKTHRSFDSMAGIFAWMMRTAGVGSLYGKKVLEIGTGQFINHPVCALVCGAKQVTTFDIKDNRGENYKDSLAYHTMANRLLSDFAPNSTLKSHMKTINQLADNVDFTAVLPENHFDVIFSYATLEHVPLGTVEGLLRYIREYSTRSVHYIDLDDDFSDNDLSAVYWDGVFDGSFVADDETYGVFWT